MMDIFNRQAPMPWGQLPTPSLDMGAEQLSPISGMPAKPPNMDLETYVAICGPGMQGPAGGNGRVGFRTANGDTGLQGANMPQPSIFGALPQMPGAPTQMPAFQPPRPMPFMPQQPMPGMQPYNFSQQMGQTAPPSPMTGQMKGMFGVR